MKTCFVALGMTMLVTVSAAAAQPDYLQEGAAFARSYASAARSDGRSADGRCGGISYGTHEESCGTETGGPSGGNANEN